MTIDLQGKFPRQFLLFVEEVLRNETGGKGDGWVNDPSDLGGCTMWGIASRSNPKLAAKIKNRTLSYAEAVELYFSKYYVNIPNVKEMDPRLAFIIFDAKVHGATVTVKFVQRWLNEKKGFSLAVDGIFGTKTAIICSKLNSAEVTSLVDDYKHAAPSLGREMATNVMATQKRNGRPIYNYAKGFTSRVFARATFAEGYMYVSESAIKNV